jgi:hypothetical protein
MYAPLNNILTRQRIAKLRRTAERRGLAGEADARRRSSRGSNLIIGACAQLAHPSARLAPTGPRAAKDRSLTPPPTTQSTS